MDLAKACGWWIPYRDVCILQHRHDKLHLNDAGQLHNPSGMAVKYRDGWGVYAWNGFRISDSDSWVITNPENITAKSINKQANAELRRIMLERIDKKRYLQETNAKLIDDDVFNKVKLLEIGTEHGRFQCTLSTCPSTGQEYIEFFGR